MKWLLIGAGGMLGADLCRRVASEHELTAVDRRLLDITDRQAVLAAVAGHDVVANCAAWTDVDGAESNEDAAFAVNAGGAANIARACQEHGARMVHFSTDYVFSGEARRPYAEDAPVSPASAYGRSKAAGESAVRAELPRDHLILRTAWLYGQQGRCFPKTIARLARVKDRVAVVDDQVGQPTWTADVADLAVRLVANEAIGTIHATSAGETSWYEFAREVVMAAGLDVGRVRPSSSNAFLRPAPRPAYSVLGHGRLDAMRIETIGDWRERWRQASSRVLL